MSLRDTWEQSQFETWCDDISRACKAADLPEPEDYGKRWLRGQTLAEVLGDMRIIKMQAELAPVQRKVA